jgi:thioredoxin-related protein
VRVGAKAPDYRGVTIDGEPYDLYESQARRILLVFWSVDCEYCHDFLVQIRKHLNLRKDYELVTFALADDRDEVCREVRRMRLRGRHFYDEARWEGKAFLDYHVVSTPMVLLLNEDKTIVCKPYQWEDLEHYLELNP